MMSVFNIAKMITVYGSAVAEILSALIICMALIKAFYNYSVSLLSKQTNIVPELIRLNFGREISLALEILIAADVLATAIAPSWDELGKLGAVVLIRTVLNFFLEKELHKIKIV